MGSPTTKRILSQEPDVTVVVGRGRNRQEFLCYGALLAYASPVLDAMLRSGMVESEKRRIEFPTKDPDEWKLFLECIDPACATLSRCEEDFDEYDFYIINDEKTEEEEKIVGDEIDEQGQNLALLNASNIMKLIPLFHELQMDTYLRACDYILHLGERKYDFWGEIADIPNEKARLLELLSFSTKYDLDRTQSAAERKIGDLLEQFCWGLGDRDNFDLATVQQLLQLFRPFRRWQKRQLLIAKKRRCNEDVKRLYRSCNCQRLWDQMSSCVDLSLISPEMINNEGTSSQVICYALHHYHNSMKAALTQIAATWIGQEGPFHLDHPSSEEGIAIGKVGEKVTWSNIHRAISKSPLSFQPDGCEKLGNLDRKYELSDDGKKIRMISTRRESPPSEWNQAVVLESEYERERIQSIETDLVVVVGSGVEMEEFQCHSVIVSFASAKLDSLIANASGRLLLPHFNPNGWKTFYKCIDPRYNGKTLVDTGRFRWIGDYSGDITTLASWFQEFEMDKHVKSCQEVADKDIKELDDSWDKYSSDHFPLFEVIRMLQFVMEQEFKNAKEMAEKLLKRWLEDCFLWKCPFCAVKELVRLCLPIQRKTAKDAYLSATCPILWEALRSRIEAHLNILTFDKVEASESEMFSHLVYAFIRCDRDGTHN